MCSIYKVVQTELEFKINFIRALRKELGNISLLIKTHENLDSYSLSILYNIFKACEFYVMEIDDKKDKSTFGGSLDLVSKTIVKECVYDV